MRPQVALGTIVTALLMSLVAPLAADGQGPDGPCLARAVEQAIDLRSRPARPHLHTLDGQDVALAEFFARCRAMHPWCCLYEKFYYWRSEVKTVVSVTPRGPVAHPIKLYHNGVSTYCPERSDPDKTHGDVAEFYDQQGVFMGLAVYMGDGQYCPLPDIRYAPAGGRHHFFGKRTLPD